MVTQRSKEERVLCEDEIHIEHILIWTEVEKYYVHCALCDLHVLSLLEVNCHSSLKIKWFIFLSQTSFEGEVSKKILTCRWLRCLSWKCYCLDDSCLLFLPRLAVWFKAKQTIFIDPSLKSMYSSDEHSTFELSWFLSHPEVMEHILESCKRGKYVIAAQPTPLLINQQRL